MTVRTITRIIKKRVNNKIFYNIIDITNLRKI